LPHSLPTMRPLGHEPSVRDSDAIGVSLFFLPRFHHQVYSFHCAMQFQLFITGSMCNQGPGLTLFFSFSMSLFQFTRRWCESSATSQRNVVERQHSVPTLFCATPTLQPMPPCFAVVHHREGRHCLRITTPAHACG